MSRREAKEKSTVPYLGGAARRKSLIGDRRGGRLVGWGAGIAAVLLERPLQEDRELEITGQKRKRNGQKNPHRFFLGWPWVEGGRREREIRAGRRRNWGEKSVTNSTRLVPLTMP